MRSIIRLLYIPLIIILVLNAILLFYIQGMQNRIAPKLESVNETTELLITLAKTATELERFLISDSKNDSLIYFESRAILEIETDSLVFIYPDQKIKTDSLVVLIDAYLQKLSQINILKATTRTENSDLIFQSGIDLKVIERQIILVLSSLNKTSNQVLIADFELSKNLTKYLFLVYLVISIVVLVATYHKLLKPLRLLRKQIKKLETGFYPQIEIDRTDEIGDLIDTFNETSKTLQISEKKLTESNKELAVANKELESFAYSVSHDLRSPLRSISGFSDALVNNYADQLDEQSTDYLNRIHKAATKMDALIDDILALSQISRREVKKKTVDITKMANDIIEFISTSENSHCKFIIEDDLSIFSDESLTKILLLNLLSNAIKFSVKTENPTIEVGSKSVDDLQYIYIKDNGVGFDMKYVDKIFGAFQRLHDQAEYKGTGIGLATVIRIINKHRGDIFYESEINKGTIVYFNLG